FAAAGVRKLLGSVSMGVIADLHHDVMHDGGERLDAFLEAMAEKRPDAIVQLGDFAYPKPKNQNLIDRFNAAHDKSFHVIGNHDTDAGSTTAQCIEMWGMPGRYYVKAIKGVQFLVLDGNDSGSPEYKGGYPSYLGAEQVAWLKGQLATLEGPIIVACHQPLAGPFAVDNAKEIQEILGSASDKVILVINGHSHIDEVVRVKDVTYLHVNSASYQWVGSDHRHQSYGEEIHAKHPWISCTCPYRDCLFTTLTVDPENLTVQVEGVRSNWVGASPAELGVDVHPSLTVGEEIAPRIRDRRLMKVITVTKNQP
ncbi:MAG: metallophosphoesterase, partial [Phycisphaerales bacterium]